MTIVTKSFRLRYAPIFLWKVEENSDFHAVKKGWKFKKFNHIKKGANMD